MLLKEIESILDKGGFEHHACEGCFDIAAQGDFTLFIKILGNVDSFQESQATNLKIISREFNAAVAVVGLHTRREMLKDSIIYGRFDVPTFTPGTLEDIILNETFPRLYRQRGGLFAEVNPEKLRSMRQKAGLSQSALAERVGVTKKSIYEHEREKKKALFGVVRKIEKIVGNVTDSAVLNFEYDVKSKPRTAFEKRVFADLKRIGLEADAVYQTPFNIVAKSDGMMLISKADDNKKRIEHDLQSVARISELTDVPAIAITGEKMRLDMPSVSEKELSGMDKRALRRMLK